MLKKSIFLFLILLTPSCNLFGPESQLKDLVEDKYKVIKKLGEGGEAIVFEVQDPKGQKFAAKLWTKEKEHNHLRGTTPFDNSVLVHTLLNDITHVNHLHEVIGDQVMILELLQGNELHKYLTRDVTKEDIIRLTNQLIDTFKSIEAKNIIPFDASAENLLIVGNATPMVKLVDTGAYIVVDEVIKANKAFDKNDFNLFKKDVLKKLLLNDKRFDSGDYYLIDKQKYALIPPVTLYSILCGRMEIFSRLLTKLAYIEAGRSNEMPHLKRFVTKGWVRAKQVSPKRVAYFLTPYGMAEKGMMVRDYLARSMAFFKEARVQSEELFQHCLDRKWYEVAVVQQGDLADIVLLVAKGLDIHVKVVSLSDDIDAFDAVIIADVQNPQGVYDILKRRVEPLRLLTLPLLHISCEDGDKGQFFYAAHTSESATLDPCRNAK